MHFDKTRMKDAVAIDEDEPLVRGCHYGTVEGTILTPAEVGLSEMLIRAKPIVRGHKLVHTSIFAIFGDNHLGDRHRLIAQRVEYELKHFDILVDRYYNRCFHMLFLVF
jgi:hypothetical protein